jgi:hypothetical protein
MGHSKELLDSIAALVRESWPATAGYRLEFEQPLYAHRALRMYPDIQVIGPGDTLRCVVEIGYTRPEKLTKYRELGIDDVRWYDKQGRLHGDIQERIEIRRIRYEADSAVRFNCILRAFAVTCWACLYGAVDGICSCNQEDCSHEPALPLSEDRRDAYVAELFENREHRETISLVVSGGSRYLGVIYCDECDRAWLMNEGEVMEIVASPTTMGFEQVYQRGKRGDIENSRVEKQSDLSQVEPIAAQIETIRLYAAACSGRLPMTACLS